MKSKPRKKMSLRELQNKLAMKVNLRFLRIFNEVYSVYSEADATSGSIAAVNMAKNPGQGAVHQVSGHIKPTKSDLIADVERAAKKVLSTFSFYKFLAFSGRKNIPETQKNLEIMDAVGKEFFRRGIYPISKYFKDEYVIPTRRNQ